MEIKEKFLRDVPEMQITLSSLGIDFKFMARTLPDENPIVSLKMVNAMFDLVQLETNYGELPLKSPPDDRIYEILRKRRLQIKRDGDTLANRVWEEYMDNSDFRSRLDSMYATFVLPVINNQRASR